MEEKELLKVTKNDLIVPNWFNSTGSIFYCRVLSNNTVAKTFITEPLSIKGVTFTVSYSEVHNIVNKTTRTDSSEKVYTQTAIMYLLCPSKTIRYYVVNGDYSKLDNVYLYSEGTDADKVLKSSLFSLIYQVDTTEFFEDCTQVHEDISYKAFSKALLDPETKMIQCGESK